MITPRLGGLGTVVARLGTSTPSPAVLTVHDTSGRIVTRRRFHDTTVLVSLPTGGYRFAVADERGLTDPRRLAGDHADVTVCAHGVVRADLRMRPGGSLHVALVRDGVGMRYGRLRATHVDGDVHDVRADRTGLVRLNGLRPGLWAVSGTDARRTWGSAPALLPVAVPGRSTDAPDTIHLELDTPTSSLLVQVPGAADHHGEPPRVRVVDGVGLEHDRALVNGSVHMRGLAPGTQTVAVPAHGGRGATTLTVPAVAPGELVAVEAVLPLPASVRGRVVGGADVRGQYAATVTLLDEDGYEIGRTRTDELGHFELAHGALARTGLTIVATSGPEALHVTRAASADVAIAPGLRVDLGDLVLPYGGRDADWTPSNRTVAAMKLPSTRL